MELILQGSRNTSDILEPRNLQKKDNGGFGRGRGIYSRYAVLQKKVSPGYTSICSVGDPAIGYSKSHTQHQINIGTASFQLLFCKAQCTCDAFRASSSSFRKFWFRLMERGELISFLYDGDWALGDWAHGSLLHPMFVHELHGNPNQAIMG